MPNSGMEPSGTTSAWHSAKSDETPDALSDAFDRCLRHEGVTAALRMLNARTRFRFTGLYRVVPPELHNVSLYDRENPSLTMSGAVCGLSDTYCSIVFDSGRAFQVGDTLLEEQLRAHKARESVQSYAGVPIRSADGAVIGTLCHFDGRPRILPASELSVLVHLASLLAPSLHGSVR